VSTESSISRAVAAFAAFALVLVSVLVPARPLIAQRSLASGAQMSREISVQIAERASQDVQSDTTAVLPLKSESQAVIWSGLLPGGGQFYAGKPVKGIILLGITAGGAAYVFSCNDNAEFEKCFPNLVLGSLMSLGGWGIGRLTAAGDAREYNEKHARRTSIEPVLDRHLGRTGLGLALRY
jgi:hypothetical protein